MKLPHGAARARWIVAVALSSGMPAAAVAAGNEDTGAKAAPTVQIDIEAVGRRRFDETLTGYGLVSAANGAESSVALTRAGRIVRLYVGAGQFVRRGTPLFEFATAEADRIAFDQARSTVTLTRGELERSRSLYAQKLATTSQLAAAEKALSDAEAALAAQQRMGTDKTTQSVAAPFDGVVSSVASGQGDVLVAGAAVLKLARTGRIQVQLGVEPEDIARVKPGMPVRISSLFKPSNATSAQVGLVHGTVNPQTRLVDVTVPLDSAASNLLIGTRVRGDITIGSQDMITVPRSAVLSDDKGSFVFQVKDRKARRVAVEVKGESDGRLAITGPVDAALPIVVTGNYELADGMVVRSAGR